MRKKNSLLLSSARAAWVFYHQSRDVNEFFKENGAVSRKNYFRILALASIDILITLPVGVVSTVLHFLQVAEDNKVVPLYSGWSVVHADWTPVSMKWAGIHASARSRQLYFSFWTSLTLPFFIFALFGATSEARAAYKRAINCVCAWFGRRPTIPCQCDAAGCSYGENAYEYSPRVDFSGRSWCVC